MAGSSNPQSSRLEIWSNLDKVQKCRLVSELVGWLVG